MSATTTYEIIAVQASARLATVRFQNPYYTGAHIVQRQRPVLGEDGQPVLDEDGEPTGEVETYDSDEDPNPHMTKHVTIPLDAGGGVDEAAFVARLAEQACGVRARMDAARAAQLASGFDDLVGFTTPSP